MSIPSVRRMTLNSLMPETHKLLFSFGLKLILLIMFLKWWTASTLSETNSGKFERPCMTLGGYPFFPVLSYYRLTIRTVESA